MSRQTEVEQLIAVGRIVLAAVSLLAIWLDPSAPTRYAPTAYGLLSGYGIYALVVASLVWVSPLPRVYLAVTTHALDLATFTLLMYFTEGPTSPFFIYFLFALLCGTLRWQWRGTLWTGLGALGAFIGLGIYAGEVLQDPAFELDRLIIRSVYLSVMAGLLAGLAVYEERRRHEMTKLAALPHPVQMDPKPVVGEMLAHAAQVLNAPRVVMAWMEPEEPWLQLAAWSAGELRWTREAPGLMEPLVAEPLADSDFFSLNARAAAPRVFYMSPAGLQVWSGAPLHAELQARLAGDAVLALTLRSENVEGWLFALDGPRLTSDDLVLGQIVARQVAARLSRLYLVERLRQAAATNERIRLARDLHDGLLQSLTGIALQLQAVRRLVEAEPREARDRLREVQALIAGEQVALRSFIRELKPLPLGALNGDHSLGSRLEELAERVSRHWGFHVEVKAQHDGAFIPDALAHEIQQIVHEAVVNAARHAEATTVRVELGASARQVRITIADNGRGFTFRGHYDLAALTAMGQGPATLKERVAALGGSLIIDSTDSGAHLDITLPLTDGV